jgi:tetratricopeptide (TPR) repeat protein
VAYPWHDFNDQWDYNDPGKTEAAFRELLTKNGNADQDYLLQLKTQIARALGLKGKYPEAHHLLDQVERSMQPGSLVEVRYMLERGRAFNSDKQPEKALLLFSEASALAQKLGADFFTVDALHMLGIAAPQAARMEWNLKAIQFAENSRDERARGWLATLYNNIGWTHFDEGRYEDALELFEKAVPLREKKGEAEPLRIAKWCVARALRAVRRVDEALAMQLADTNPDGFTHEEIGECLLALGRNSEARVEFAKAYEILKDLSWVAEDTQRISRLKELAGL